MSPRLFFVLAALAAAPATGSAQDQAVVAADAPWKHVVFGVTLEGYYEYNWNRPPDRVNVLRAYDTRANSFSLQQVVALAELPAAPEDGRRFGVRLDLQFGQATETVQGSAANEPRPDTYRHIWQAYGTYVFPVGRGLTTDFGKFASMLGYETNYAKDNQAFSRAYLFNFLPFYHAGLRLSLPLSKKATVLYMLTNGVQETEDFNDFKSQHVAAILKPAPAVTWTLNYYFGREQPDQGQPAGPNGWFRVLDTYVTVTPTAKLTLGADVNRTTSEVTTSSTQLALQGTAGYARYQVTAPFAIGARYERLNDDGIFGGIEQRLQEITLTAEHKLADGFLVRGELRRDWSNRAFFPGPRPGEARPHQNTGLVGLVWWGGSKRGAW